MRLAQLRAQSRRWRRDGEERQGPGPTAPGKADDRSAAEPPDTRGRRRMTGLGAHGIMVDPFVRDAPAEATFERVIDGNNQGLIGPDEGVDDQPEQDPAELQGRPDGSVQEAMVGREMALVDQADGPQGGRDGAAIPAGYPR